MLQSPLAARFPPHARRKREFYGGIVGFIGFMLSPLSWWNDLFVNVPLALAFASLVSWINPRFFAACFVVGYWATNVLGLLMMQKGAGLIMSKEPKPYSKRSLRIDLGVSLAYTAVIVLLIHYGFLKPLTHPLLPSSSK